MYHTSLFILVTLLVCSAAAIHSVAAQRNASKVASNLGAFVNSTDTAGGETISTTDSARTVFILSGASFSDSSARSRGDTTATVESPEAEGLPVSSGSTAGQCPNSGVGLLSHYMYQYEMNWPLFLYMVTFFVLINIKCCINCVAYTVGFIVYCFIVIIVSLADIDSDHDTSIILI